MTLNIITTSPTPRLIHRALTLASDLTLVKDNVFEGVIYLTGKTLNASVIQESSIPSGISVFTNALMFANHPTFDEEWSRPEGDVRNVIGVVREAFRSDVNGVAALGGKFVLNPREEKLISNIDLKIVNGLSVNAWTEGFENDETGNYHVTGWVTNWSELSLSPPRVDLVTYAAAGGMLERMVASYREGVKNFYFPNVKLTDTKTEQVTKTEAVEERHTHTTNNQNIQPDMEDNTMTDFSQEHEETLKRLERDNQQMKAELERLRINATRRTNAQTLVDASVQEVQNLPLPAIERIRNAANSIVEQWLEGDEDIATLSERVKQAISLERDYVRTLTGAGKPSNVGSISGATEQDVTPEEIARLSAGYNDLTTVIQGTRIQ